VATGWHPDTTDPATIATPPPVGAMAPLRRGASIARRNPPASPGVFTGNPLPPQSPGESATGAWQSTLAEDAGLRVAYTTGRRLWFSGLLENVQRFLSPAWPNSPENLEVAAVQINSRRALSRFRGTETPETVE
jgi:hypothetical protein